METIQSIRRLFSRFFSFVKKVFLRTARWIRKHSPLLKNLFAAGIGIFTMSVLLFYILFPSRGFFHSDSTDTIMWAQAMLDAKGFYEPDFNYAAFMPFGGQLLMLPFVALFGVSMNAQVLGMSLFLILFFGAILFLCRSIPTGWIGAVVTAFVLTLGVAGSDKMREIFYGHIIYYSLGTLFMIFGLGIVLRMRDKAAQWLAKKKWIKLVLFVFFGSSFFALAALNGLQSWTLFIIPVLGGFFLGTIIDGSQPLFAKGNRPFWLVFIVLVAFILIGVYFNIQISKEVTQGYADAYSNYSAPSEWIKNLQKFLEQWLTLLGVDISNGDPLKSVESVINLVRILFGFLILIIPFVALLKIDKISNQKVRVVILTHWIMTALLMVGYVFGYLSSANWRLSPLVASSILASVVYLGSLTHAIPTRSLAVVMMIPLIAYGALTAWTIVKMEPDHNQEYGYNDCYYLARELDNLGLTYGYASFWNANAVTVVSDSRVRVRAINSDFGIYHYQSQLSWYEDQEGVDRYFVLLTKAEYQRVGSAEWFDLEHEEVILNGPSRYYVLIFSENIFGGD